MCFTDNFLLPRFSVYLCQWASQVTSQVSASQVTSQVSASQVNGTSSEECYLIFPFTFLAFLPCFPTKKLLLFSFLVLMKYGISATEY